MTRRVDIAIAIIHCSEAEVVIVRREDSELWDFPGTKIAEGETDHQAAARVATLITGLDIDESRFGKEIRRELGTDGKIRASYRVHLNSNEYDILPERSPDGSRRLFIAHKRELRRYIPAKYRVRMMQAGPVRS